MATHTEESLAALRGQIAAKLESSKQFEQEVSELILSVLRQERSVKNHGKILWHLMAKEPAADGVQRVVAKKAGVYLQYYIISVLSSAKSRPFNRTLSSMELAWLTAIAHAGYDKGRSMMDDVLAGTPVTEVQALLITQESFLRFFHGEPGKFGLVSSLAILDKVWEMWDYADPKFIHGFVTPLYSKRCLEARQTKPGSFLFRFDSSGGLTIDYIKSDSSLNSGKVEPSALQNSLTLHSTLMQSSELIGLVDSRSEFTDATVPKELMPQLAMNRKGAPTISGDQVQQQPIVPAQPLSAVPPAAPPAAQTSNLAPVTPAPVANPGGFSSEASKSQPDYGEDKDDDEDGDSDEDDDGDGGDDDGGDDEEDDDDNDDDNDNDDEKDNDDNEEDNEDDE